MFRTMKGSPADLSKLTYPLFASEKLDGFRCTVLPLAFARRHLKVNPKSEEYFLRAQSCIAISPSGKPIRNWSIQETLDDPQFAFCDGELLAGNKFAQSASSLARQNGTPDFNFYVFDYIRDIKAPFHYRLKMLLDRLKPMNKGHGAIFPHAQSFVQDKRMLHEIIERLQNTDAEGIVTRHPDRPYKYGRGTLREQSMLKLKFLVDDEAEIIDVKELLHNNNPAEQNELGLTRRSAHQNNKTCSGVLGSFICRMRDGTEFCIGTGFTAEDRQVYWAQWHQGALRGYWAKFQHLPAGAQEAPRNPVFLGLRPPEDIT